MIISKDIIDFELINSSLVIANDKELIDESKNQVLISFDNAINAGSIVIGSDMIFAGDIYGINKVIKDGEIEELSYAVKETINENSFIAQLKSPKRTAKIDSKGSILWEVDFKSFRNHIVNDKVIILEDKRLSENQKFVVLNLLTGEELYNIDFGNFLPSVLGFSSELVWISSEEERFIKSVEIETGQIIDEISTELLEEISESNIDIEYFKFDSESKELIHPYGDLDLNTKHFRRRVYFDNQQFNVNVWMPNVFPFYLSSKYLIFGIQEDYPATKETKTRLVIINRVTQELYAEIAINDKKVDAGLRKITLQGETLVFIDSYNNLHEIQLNQET